MSGVVPAAVAGLLRAGGQGQWGGQERVRFGDVVDKAECARGRCDAVQRHGDPGGLYPRAAR